MSPKHQHLTVPEQFLALRTSPVCVGSGRLRHEQLVWRFESRPSPFGRCYGARMELGQSGPPKVHVISPDLHELAGGRRLPHVYSDHPPHLCLYLPGAFEWNRSHRLDRTIVPWTALWLFYFEEWLWSDDWKGGGVHPGELEAMRIARREHAA